MSLAVEPGIEDRLEGRGINLVALARPYFGLMGAASELCKQ